MEKYKKHEIEIIKESPSCVKYVINGEEGSCSYEETFEKLFPGCKVSLERDVAQNFLRVSTADAYKYIEISSNVGTNQPVSYSLVQLQEEFTRVFSQIDVWLSGLRTGRRKFELYTKERNEQ